MTESASDIASLMGSSVETGVKNLSERGPTSIICVGRPDAEEPHRSMKRVVKLRADNPAIKLFILVWTPEDLLAMKAYEDENVKVLYWDTDEGLSSFLMDFLSDIAGAFIVGPRYYICPEKHITEGSYAFIVKECGTCKAPVEIVQMFEDRAKEFGELFLKVIRLTNFDTRSGEYLQSVVSPTANILNNAPYIVGCEHAGPLDARGSGKEKTAIIVGAGPSLEEAIPHLVRLSKKPEYFVFAVGRTFKMLHAAGVRVAYVASCEMFDWDAAIFDGVTPIMADETVLAFASMCAPATVKAWPGRKVPMLDMESARLLKRDDWIYGGNSVAHHMLNFAFQILDAKDAILVGIDLAYTKPKSHADGSNHDGWPDDIRQAEENFQDEAWVPCTGKGDVFDPSCHRMPVAMGGGGVAISRQMIVRSSPSYQCFATLFSILISKHKRKVFNGCGNGQKIGGTEYIDLGTIE